MPYDVGSIVGRIRMDTTQWDQTRLRIVSNVRGLAASFAVAGAAMATPLVAAAKEFGNFELAMRKATSVSETTEEQFRAMSKQAEVASVKWGEAAETQAKAFLFLGRAGLTAVQQMEAFDPVIMASKAMMEDLEKTAEGVVNVMNSFGIGFEHTGYIADVMTKAVNASTMNLQELMVALSYAGKPAKAFNNTIEDTAAMIGLVANEGIRGSKAGTALRFALTALASPTAEARNLLHELGIQVYNMSTGQMLPFLDIMSQLEVRLEGASEQLRNYMLETLFGRRAMPAMIALFDKGSQGVREFSNSLQRANGITKETAEKQMNALISRAQQAWQALLMLARHIITTVAPAITRLGERIRDFVGLLVEWVDANQGIVKSWVEQEAHVAWLALKWGALLVVGSIAAGTFKKVYEVMASLTRVLVDTARVVGTLIVRHIALISQLLLIGAALYMARVLWGEFGDKVKEIMDDFVDYVKNMADKVRNYLEGMIPDTIEEKFKKFLGWAVNFKDNMNKLVGQAAGTLMGNPITRPLGFALSFDQWRMNKMFGMGSQVGKNMDAGKESLSNVFGKTTEYMKKDFQSLKETLSPMLSDILGYGKDVGLGLLKEADAAMDKLLLSLVPDKLKELWDMAARQLKIGQFSVPSAMYGLKGATHFESSSNLKYTTEQYKELWMGAILSVRETMMSSQDIMEGGMKDIVSGWTDAFDKLMEKGSNFVDFMDSMFQSILRSFVHMVSQMAAQSLFTQMFGRAGGGDSTVTGGGVGLFQTIWSMLTQQRPFTYPASGGGYTPPTAPDITNIPASWGFPGNVSAPKIVINNNGTPMDVQQVSQKRVGNESVITIVMDEIERNPRFRDMVRGTR